MTLADLNAMDRAAFNAALGWIFEHSAWVAARAWTRRPFSGVDTLHAAMIAEVEAASAAEQLALLRAHPDLGARARLTDASAGEQAGAGLDRLTSAEFGQLQRLNTAYREKFGFPFLYAVKGATKYDILQAIETRLAESPGREYQEALRQVYRIAGFRLQDTVS